jgi:Mg-chelatase subunit ChlD
MGYKIFKQLFLIAGILASSFLLLQSEQQVAALKPLDIFLAIDQSGSMKLSDPENIRLNSAKYFIDFLAAHRSDYFNHRIGIINFGDKPPINPDEEMIPLTDLSTSNLEQLKASIKAMNLGDTSFINALHKAHEGFLKAGNIEGRQKVIIFFTDGEPDDTRKWSKDKYFAEISDFVTKNLNDCQLILIGIDVRNVYWQNDSKFWSEITRGQLYRLSKMEEKELDKIYSSIVTQLLRVPEIRWDNVPPEGVDVRIEPYLEKVTFSILKENPEVKLGIYRPDGKKVSEQSSDVKYFPHDFSEIYSITDPEPGTWRYKIEKGKGKVEVGKTIIPVEVRLLSPQIPHPFGKPIKVRASFLKRDGSPVREHPAYRLWLGAKIITPRSTESVELIPISKGMYGVNKEFSAEQEGEYFIELTMKGGNIIISEVKVPIEMKVMPYIKVVQPEDNKNFSLRSDLDVEVNLMLKNQFADPSKLFQDNPNSILWAQIEHNKKIIKSIKLFQDEDRKWTFSGKIEGLHQAGQYKLLIQLGGKLMTGEPFESPTAEELIFQKRMDVTDFLIFRWYLALLFVALVAFIIDWATILSENKWWGWRIECPQLSGNLEIVKNNGERETIILKGRKKRFKELGITLIARKIKETQEDGEISLETKIFVKWNRIAKPEEELSQNIPLPINDDTTISFYY